MAKVNVDGLANAIMSELKNYQKTTVEAVEKAVKDTAKMTVMELNHSSPVDSGDYAGSWRYKRDKDVVGRHRYDMVVYSKKPNYRLTHLLEKGHAKRGGGRVRAIVHIKPAEEHAKEMLEERIINSI